MKQNSSILFHDMHNLLINSYLRERKTVAATFVFCLSGFFWASAMVNAADKPEYCASFNPAKGFKPAQRDLTEIFLQIAGSLENGDGPEHYLRHVMKEDARIRELYAKERSAPTRTFLPAYMTEDYMTRLSANWDLLSPKLGLAPFAKEIGALMQDAIHGTRGSGTMVVEILNQHQAKVFDAMTGKGHIPADFNALKAELIRRLELDKPSVDEERYSPERRDAVSYAIIIHGTTMKLFKRLDQGLKPADAERIKSALTSVYMDVGRAAQAELEMGLAEWALRAPTSANPAN